MGLRIASLTISMMPVTRLTAVDLICSIGAVKIRSARAQAAPGFNRSPGRLRLLMNSVTADLIIEPVRPSALICSSTNAPAFSKTPLLSSACVISPPPGMISISARRMLAALRSTGLMLIGLTPSMIVNMRKPGIMLALPASQSSGSGMPRSMPSKPCGRGDVRCCTLNFSPRTAAAEARSASFSSASPRPVVKFCITAPRLCWTTCATSCAISRKSLGDSPGPRKML